MPGTPAMGQGDPGAGAGGDNPEVDEQGNPIPAPQNGMPQGAGQPGQTLQSPPGQPAPGVGKGNPAAISRIPGKRNTTR